MRTTSITPVREKSNVGADGKYLRLVEHCIVLIHSGALKIGDRLPTYVELQSEFGMTPNTINRAMIALEQEGWVERRRGSGVYVAARVPETQTVTNGQRGIIGLCGSAFWGSASSSYWTHVVEGVRTQAEAVGTQILLLPYPVKQGWEKADGVLTCDLLDASHRSEIPDQLPIVSMFGVRPNWAGVRADEYSGLRQATEHLLALGHRRIAYLHGLDMLIVSRRLQAFQDALHKAGIVPQKNWLHLLPGKMDSGPQFTAAGRNEMSDWLKDDGLNGWKQLGCTALICHNDDTAIGVMQALNDVGLKVPHDVSIVGFDGTEVGEYSSPQLTTVEMPLQRMGEIAIGLLQKQIEADDVIVEHITLPTQLRVRESTSAPARH